MSVIVIDKLVKRYGRIEALKGVSMEVGAGEIFGLLGQNGAGKTTLIKILLGILSPTEGRASLLGQPVGKVSVRRQIGYLPEDHRFPEYHTGYSLLDYYGTLLEMPASKRRARIPQVLEQVDIAERMHYKIRTYSKGMKQRLGVAQALMHDPKVLFLDEPTDGVDPVGRREIRYLLQDLQKKGVTIFINSHLLGEVELLCDRVIILHKGIIERQGRIADLTQQTGTYSIGLADQQQLPVAELQQMQYSVTVRRDGTWEVDLREGQSIDPVVDLIRSQGLSLRHLVEKRQTLEDLFVQTVEEVDEPEPAARRRASSQRSSSSSRDAEVERGGRR